MRLAAFSLLALAVLALAAPDLPARSRPGVSRSARVRRERWKRGQCSAPERERVFVGQRLGPGRVSASMLVNVEEHVAGADGLRPRKGRAPEERFLVTAEVARALIELRAEVKREFGPEYDLWLNGAYDSTGLVRRRHNSMHVSGRAVDVDLYLLPSGKRRGGKVNHMTGELAPVVARVFLRQTTPDGRPLRAWVLNEGNHVHASLESPSVEARLVAMVWPPLD